MARQVIDLSGFTLFRKNATVVAIEIFVKVSIGKTLSAGTTQISQINLYKSSGSIYIYKNSGDDFNLRFNGQITMKWGTQDFVFEPDLTFVSQIGSNFTGDKLAEFKEFFDHLFRVTSADFKAASPQLIIDDGIVADQPGVLTPGWDVEPVANQVLNAPAFTDPDGGVRNIRYRWEQYLDVITGWGLLTLASTYTPGDSQAGFDIRVQITYDDSHGINKTLTATFTKPVKAAPADQLGSLLPWPADLKVAIHTRIYAPTLSDPDGGIRNIRYQWQRKNHDPSATTWANITGANREYYIPAYTVSVDDTAMVFRVVTTYDDANRTDRVLTSPPTPNYVAEDQRGTIEGWSVTPKVGTALAIPTFTDPDGGIVIKTYVWRRSADGSSWRNVGTGLTYTPVTADAGHFLQVLIFYNDTFRTDRNIQSFPTSSVIDPDTPGSIAPWRDDQLFHVGSRIVAPSVTDPDGVSNERFQWQIESNIGTGTYADILGETLSELIIPENQGFIRGRETSDDRGGIFSLSTIGRKLKVEVTYDDTLKTDIVLFSETSAPIIAKPAPTFSPGATLSDAIKEAYASAPVGQTILETVELRHSKFGGPVRMVNDHEDLQAFLEADAPVDAGKEVTFMKFAFTATLPPTNEKAAPELIFSVDNTSLELVEEFEKVVDSLEPIKLTYRPYLLNDLSGPQYNPPLTLTLKDVTVTTAKITARAGFRDYAAKKFPGEVYTPKNFPGLIR